MSDHFQKALIEHGWKRVLSEPPETSGIYAFLFWKPKMDWVVAYVGQARDLSARFRGHRLYLTALAELTTKTEQWVLECEPSKLDSLERQYIRLLAPRHNKSPGPGQQEVTRALNNLMRKMNRHFADPEELEDELDQSLNHEDVVV